MPCGLEEVERGKLADIPEIMAESLSGPFGIQAAHGFEFSKSLFNMVQVGLLNFSRG